MLKIVEIKPGETGRALRTLLITVEGGSLEEVNSVEAKKLAYAARIEQGFPDAGIEYVGGSFPSGELPDAYMETAEPAPMAYRRMFQLTQAL